MTHLKGVKRDAIMARAAVDAYLEAAKEGRFGTIGPAVFRVVRALEIALEVGDEERIARSRSVLIELASRADDADEGLWVHAYDSLVDRPTPRLALMPAEEASVLQDLETRLARLALRPSDGYAPSGVAAAAVRLARYHRRKQRSDDVRRVLLLYRDAVLGMHGVAEPLIFASVLEELFRILHDFRLDEDASALTSRLAAAGVASVGAMRPLETTIEIPLAKVDSFFAYLLSGSSAEALARMVVEFLPKKADAERQLRDLARDAPLYFLIPLSIKDSDGRTVAKVGSLEEDFEGRLIQRLSQELALGSPWLRGAMERGTEQHEWSPDFLLDHLLRSPLFRETKRTLLARALEAYYLGDGVVAVHLLVPQIEAAIRQLARLSGAPLYRTRKGGRVELLSLDQLLNSEKVASLLGNDTTIYLRALLTDPRGWNVRNVVCHGLIEPNAITAAVADRVVHAILTLGYTRAAPAVDEVQVSDTMELTTDQGEDNEDEQEMEHSPPPPVEAPRDG
jgi:hypothetical protein